MEKMKIGIISVGVGNIASVKNMILQIGLECDLLTNPNDSIFYDWIILPGVGSFDNGIKKLRTSGWYNWLKKNQSCKENNSSILGICLGMQLLCDGSEEGNLDGLGLIPGFFKKFNFETTNSLKLNVPHMCWNEVLYDESKVVWGNQINMQNPRYYFVHSYYYTNNTDKYIFGTTNYGINFGSGIINNNIIGLQFHPEKSHKFGKFLLKKILICQN